MFSQLDGQEAKNKRVKNIVGQPTGTKIGLNLCLTFVHLMNGEIWVSNNTGGSFQFQMASEKQRRLAHRLVA
jgi:K+-sensing histidine kinase KdpD